MTLCQTDGRERRLVDHEHDRLHVTNKEHVLASMADNLDDLYFVGQPPEDIDIVVLAAPGHPLANKKKITLEQLAREPGLMREKGFGTRNAIERQFAESGITLRPRLELGNNEAIM